MKKQTTSDIIKFSLIPTIIPIFTIGVINLIKLHNIKKNKRTKTLSLDNISHSITFEKLREYEDFSHSVISGNVKQLNNDDKHTEIDIVDGQFVGIKCSKKFIFCDNQLSICNYIFDRSCDSSKAEHVYKELIRINSKPDRKKYERKICRLQYNWYGMNGEIVYYKFSNNMVVIVFEIKK